MSLKASVYGAFKGFSKTLVTVVHTFNNFPHGKLTAKGHLVTESVKITTLQAAIVQTSSSFVQDFSTRHRAALTASGLQISDAWPPFRYRGGKNGIVAGDCVTYRRRGTTQRMRVPHRSGATDVARRKTSGGVTTAGSQPAGGRSARRSTPT